MRPKPFSRTFLIFCGYASSAGQKEPGFQTGKNRNGPAIPLGERTAYSYFKELAGLARAAFRVWELTVIKATIRTAAAAQRNDRTDIP